MSFRYDAARTVVPHEASPTGDSGGCGGCGRVGVSEDSDPARVPLVLRKMPLLGTAWNDIPLGRVGTRFQITRLVSGYRNQLFRHLAVSGSCHGHQHLERSEEHTSELQSLTNLVCR